MHPAIYRGKKIALKGLNTEHLLDLEKKAKDVRRDLFAPNFRAKKPLIDFVQFQVKA